MTGRGAQFPGFYSCQREALRKFLSRADKEGRVQGVIQVLTGTGKTLLAVSIIKALMLKGLLNYGYVLFLEPRFKFNKSYVFVE